TTLPEAQITPEQRPQTVSIRPSSGVREQMHAGRVDPASTQPGKLEIKPTTGPFVDPDPYMADALVAPASLSVAIPDSSNMPSAKRGSVSPRWTTIVLVVAGIAIGLSAFAALYTMLNSNVTAVVPVDTTVGVSSELREELHRRRTEIRTRVQDGEEIS